jgi:hypothetical protein
VRDLQEILRIGNSGKSSPGRGGRWQSSAGIRENQEGSGGRRRRSECGEWWGSLGAQEERSERCNGRSSGAAQTGSERLSDSATEGRKGEIKVGVRAWGCHVARGRCGAWPRPASGAGSSPRAARAGDVRRARACRSKQSGRERTVRWVGTVPGGSVTDRRGVGLSAARGECRRGARLRGCGWAGPRRNGVGRPDAQCVFGFI